MLIEWSNKQQRAAHLVAEGALTSAAIAADVGVSPATLRTWRRDLAFRGRVWELKDAYADALRTEGIRSKEYRLQQLEELYAELEQIRKDRAANPALQDVPGGTTGLIIRRERIAGRGRNATRIVEDRIDVAYLRQCMAILQQVAEELGEWGKPLTDSSSASAGPNIVYYTPGERARQGAESA